MHLILLSDKFYNEHSSCTEILQKRNRPYVCVTVNIGDKLFAIPIRHHIRHKYAFFTIGEAGLDYTKAVVIKDETDLSTSKAVIDTKEFQIIKTQEARIVRELKKYIELYKKAKQHSENPHYENILSKSTLQYFDELI